MSTQVSTPLADLGAGALWQAMQGAAAGRRDGHAGEVARLCGSAGSPRLGWIIPAPWPAVAAATTAIERRLGRPGVRRAVLLGTGGWSFAAQALCELPGRRGIRALDSLDPVAIRSVLGRCARAVPGCVAVSASGATLETLRLVEAARAYGFPEPVWLRDEASAPDAFALSAGGDRDHVAMLGAPLSLAFLLPAAVADRADLARAYSRLRARYQMIGERVAHRAAAMPLDGPVQVRLAPPLWAGTGLRRWLLQLGRQVLCGKPGQFRPVVTVERAAHPGRRVELRLDRAAPRPGLSSLLDVLYAAGVFVGCLALRAGLPVAEHDNVRAYKDLLGQADPELPARSVTDLTEPAAGWLSGRPDLRRLHLVHYGTPAPAAATSRDVTALTGRPCEVHEGSAWNHHSFHAVYAEPATAVLVAVASDGAVPAPLAPAARTLRQIAVATHLALADRSLLVEYAPPVVAGARR